MTIDEKNLFAILFVVHIASLLVTLPAMGYWNTTTHVKFYSREPMSKLRYMVWSSCENFMPLMMLAMLLGVLLAPLLAIPSIIYLMSFLKGYDGGYDNYKKEVARKEDRERMLALEKAEKEYNRKIQELDKELEEVRAKKSSDDYLTFKVK